MSSQYHFDTHFCQDTAIGDIVLAVDEDSQNEEGIDMIITGMRYGHITTNSFYIKLVPFELYQDEMYDEEGYIIPVIYGDKYSISVWALTSLNVSILPGWMTGVRTILLNQSDDESESKTPLQKRNKLVGLKHGSCQDSEAKFEAYMDPTVAALSETKGRITRNKFYPSIKCKE